MFIKLPSLIDKYGLKIKGIIHGGAHKGQEVTDYISCGVNRIILIEPCEKAFSYLEDKFSDDKRIDLFNVALGASECKAIMNVEEANDGQSNSILVPKQHLDDFPNIQFVDIEYVFVKRLDDLHFDKKKYNFINFDLQGYELEALKGAEKTLKHIDYCYLEVNRSEMYKNNAMIGHIDNYLSDYGFRRAETFWCQGGKRGSWGDAFYIK